jgi:hypothetical protein
MFRGLTSLTTSAVVKHSFPIGGRNGVKGAVLWRSSQTLEAVSSA